MEEIMIIPQHADLTMLGFVLGVKVWKNFKWICNLMWLQHGIQYLMATHKYINFF